MQSRVINNATAVYIIMMAVFAAGIWAVLAYGATLEAQPDLAGEWELVAAGAKPFKATIEQSGRFLRLRIKSESETPMDLRMNDRDARTVSTAGAGQPIVMTGRTGAQVTFTPTADPDVFNLSLPDGRSFVANFVTRTYATKRGSAKPSH